jgi:hypothetical protein
MRFSPARPSRRPPAVAYILASPHSHPHWRRRRSTAISRRRLRRCRCRKHAVLYALTATVPPSMSVTVLVLQGCVGAYMGRLVTFAIPHGAALDCTQPLRRGGRRDKKDLRKSNTHWPVWITRCCAGFQRQLSSIMSRRCAMPRLRGSVQPRQKDRHGARSLLLVLIALTSPEDHVRVYQS